MAVGQIKQKQDRIDQQQFEALCQIQCTQVEICAVLGCNTDTLDSWCKNTYGKGFSETYAIKREGGKASLRRTQWKVANETENATMLIWLGKQYLNQTEKIEQENVERVIFTDDINPTADR